jgi:hypothetical protein
MQKKDQVKKISSLSNTDLNLPVVAFLVGLGSFFIVLQVESLKDYSSIIATVCGMLAYMFFKPSKKQVDKVTTQQKRAAVSSKEFYADNINMRVSSARWSYLLLSIVTFPILVIFPIVFLYAYFTGNSVIKSNPQDTDLDLFLGLVLLVLSWLPLLFIKSAIAISGEDKFLSKNLGSAQLIIDNEAIYIFSGILYNNKLRRNLGLRKSFMLKIDKADISEIEVTDIRRSGAAVIPAFYKIHVKNKAADEYAKIAGMKSIYINRALFIDSDNEIVTLLKQV